MDTAITLKIDEYQQLQDKANTLDVLLSTQREKTHWNKMIQDNADINKKYLIVQRNIWQDILRENLRLQANEKVLSQVEYDILKDKANTLDGLLSSQRENLRLQANEIILSQIKYDVLKDKADAYDEWELKIKHDTEMQYTEDDLYALLKMVDDIGYRMDQRKLIIELFKKRKFDK